MISLFFTILGFAVPALGGLGIAGSILGWLFKLGRLEWLEAAVPILGRLCIAILEVASWLIGKTFSVLGQGFAICFSNPAAFSVVALAFVIARTVYPDGPGGPPVKSPFRVVSPEKPSSHTPRRTSRSTWHRTRVAPAPAAKPKSNWVCQAFSDRCP